MANEEEGEWMQERRMDRGVWFADAEGEEVEAWSKGKV